MYSKTQYANIAYASSEAVPRLVVILSGRAGGNARSHESMTQTGIARRLAALQGFEFAGTYDETERYPRPPYFVPDETLVGTAQAKQLGISSEEDLFGGVVPFPFVSTKAITHPLVRDDAFAPDGWSPVFGKQVRDVVLPGFSAFTLDDALTAGARLLEQGAVRIKKPCGVGGLGQSVVKNKEDLERELLSLDIAELAREGIVVEKNLVDVETFSVGRVSVGKLVVTYCGTQRLTTNNRGMSVYGGSSLLLVRGEFDTLLRRDLPPATRTAIAQARAYHSAVLQCYPGMFASRCNYDVARGVDEEGKLLSGVLEQSWRIGGASGAEVAALDAFHANSGLATVRASTTEVYGENPILPPDAHIYFQGVDERIGPITKYARLESHADA